MMMIEGRKALVLGAGKSGIASARFLAERAPIVALHDKKTGRGVDRCCEILKAIDTMSGLSAAICRRGCSTRSIWSLFRRACRQIRSRPDTSIAKTAKSSARSSLRIDSMKGRIVGITGSNGKTTTTALIGELLKNAGITTQVGGNIGTPLLSLTETSTDDGWTVAELSSFQLETIKDFRPNVAICLNVTPNHLDRYDSFTDYAAAKHRIFMNQTADDRRHSECR